MLPPISLFAALDEMNKHDADETPVPFDLEFVTGNLSGKAGAGRIIRLKNVFLAKYKRDIPFHIRQDYIPVASSQITEPRLRNSIKRLWVPQTQEIKNANIRLITKFNGREINWHD